MTTTQLPAPSHSGAVSAASAPLFSTALTRNVVFLWNFGEEDFTRKYGPTDRLTIPAGAKVMVTEDVAAHFVGRWWTTNNDPRNRERADNLQWLRGYYGAYEDEDVWEKTKPTLKLLDSGGNEVPTLLDDPEGLSVGGQTPLGREMNLEQQVSQLHGLLLNLQSQLDTERLARISQEQGAPTPEPTPSSPYDPSIQPPGPATRDLGPAGMPPVPVAAPPVPHSAPVVVDGEVAVNEETVGRLPVHAQPIDPDADAPPPVDRPSRTRVMGG